MTDLTIMNEQELRDKIAAEIAAKFGSLAPYKMVQEFVRTGK